MENEGKDSSFLPENIRILIVDDVPENIRLLGSLLRAEGYQVIPATSGVQALGAVKDDPPDLILLDVMMPEMSGYEVLEKLKADTGTRAIPVIFVTALTDEEDETKGLKAGAVDYLTKPISAPICLARVQTHLSLRIASMRLEEQNERLIEAARLREDVERMTHHDLKSPLSGIIAYPNLIAESEHLTESGAEMLGRIKSNGYRMLDMINRSLDMFKMEQGTYKYEPEDVDLLSVVREVVSGYERLAKFHGIEFGVTVNEGEATADESFIVRCEELLCYSMVSNIIKNALEASPAGGAVWIGLASGESNVIRVENQGEVPEAIRGRFFEKYATSGKEKGTGLGTYSARLIAKTHGGEIELDTSKPGMTAIVISLP